MKKLIQTYTYIYIHAQKNVHRNVYCEAAYHQGDSYYQGG
jgi:hypothetical protein